MTPAAPVGAGDLARVRRRRRFRQVALALTLLLGVGLSEVAVRAKYLAREQDVAREGWHEFDALRGWRARPSWSGTGTTAGATPVSFHVRTNARGLRHDREVTDRPAPGTTRIAFVGDSFVFGFGVEVEDGSVARLESALNVGAPGRHEVLNLGHCEYGIDQMRLVVEHQALPLAPDLVLVGIIDQGFRRATNAVSTTGRRRKPRFVLDGADHPPRLVGNPLPEIAPGKLFFEDGPADGGSFLLWKLGQLGERLDVALRSGERGRLRWRLGEALLRDSQRLATAAGARFAIVYFSRGDDDDPIRPLVLGLEPDVPVCDLTPAFATGDGLFIPGDGHPTPRGHAVAAEAIAAFLRARDLLPGP